jgi:hypothetical protein
MVKIQIPAELEKALTAEELSPEKQRAYCAALCEDIAPMIIQKMENKRPEVIDSAFVLFCAEKEIERRKASRPHSDGKFRSSIDRPDVGVMDPAGNFVETFQQFSEMVLSINNFKEVEYHGRDAAEMLVVQAKLPEGYVASVAWIQRKHVPQFAFDGDMVVEKRLTSGQRETYMSLCRRIHPAQTNQDYYQVPKAQIHSQYGFVTFKIKKSDNTLMAWFSGTDIHSGNTDAAHKFVLVGAHWKKKQQKPASPTESSEAPEEIFTEVTPVSQTETEVKKVKPKAKIKPKSKTKIKPNVFDTIFG